jgi:hypothetical protein
MYLHYTDRSNFTCFISQQHFPVVRNIIRLKVMGRDVEIEIEWVLIFFFIHLQLLQRSLQPSFQASNVGFSRYSAS